MGVDDSRAPRPGKIRANCQGKAARESHGALESLLERFCWGLEWCRFGVPLSTFGHDGHNRDVQDVSNGPELLGGQSSLWVISTTCRGISLRFPNSWVDNLVYESVGQTTWETWLEAGGWRLEVEHLRSITGSIGCIQE